MLERLLRRFRDEPESQGPDDNEDDLHRAVAALLVEAARADDDYTEDERMLVAHMLELRFSLPADRAEALRNKAEAAQESANDLYSFTRVVKDGLDADGKRDLIEDMWLIALSDDDRAPHEEMVIRRLVGLIHLDDTQSTVARRRAEARLAARA